LSRNSKRVTGGGGPAEQDSAPPQQNLQGQSNDFGFVVPTEFVDLPSEGTHYTDGHPLQNQSTIEIKQMTAKEEDMLTSRSLLRKGIALERVIASLIIDKSIDPATMLVGDRNAIVVAARISAYGSDYTTKVTCPNCSTQQEHTFNLNEITSDKNEIDTMMIDGVEQQEDGTFLIELPRSKLDIGFRLLTGADEMKLASGIEMDKKAKGQYEKNVTRQLKHIVTSVNGNSSADAVNYVVDNMPSLDARYLRQAFKSVSPNLNMTQEFECIECDFESDLEVPLTADFFWPDR
tara:strand:+ start:17572 stop:18444 length:873 start_codon:yes stop_codon:yes gene_type:complete